MAGSSRLFDGRLGAGGPVWGLLAVAIELGASGFVYRRREARRIVFFVIFGGDVLGTGEEQLA